MPLVIFETIAPHIAKITLNDPEALNAMGPEMAAEFLALIKKLRTEALPRVIILTGAGRAFSAGGDLDMLEAKQKIPQQENYDLMLKFYRSFLSLLDLDVPLIAAINGHAIGAGLCVASACDIRVAASGAKLGFTFAKLGLHPGMGATFFLPRALGYSNAAELLLTGRIIDAPQALRTGLVSHVVEPEKLLETALGIATEIADASPFAIRQLVASIRAPHTTLEAALEREARCQSLNYANKEFAEGVRATKEKRKPSFGA